MAAASARNRACCSGSGSPYHRGAGPGFCQPPSGHQRCNLFTHVDAVGEFAAENTQYPALIVDINFVLA
jgi:hypothetical protein